MAPGDPPTVALRPWPRAGQKPKNLAEFIARVNMQLGGFRNVTEASLREQIAKETKSEDDVDMDKESQDGDEGDSAGAGDSAVSAEEMRATREKVAKHIS